MNERHEEPTFELGNFGMYLSNHMDQGAREYQEDYFGLIDPDLTPGSLTLVLADGMGGLSGGDAASVTAVNHFHNIFPKYLEMSQQGADIALHQAIEETNQHLYEFAEGRELGTTFVALCLQKLGKKRVFTWASVGDSVLFRVRDGKIERLNHDHNLGRLLDNRVASGDLSQTVANYQFDDRELLTSHMGMEVIPELEVSQAGEWMPGDVYVLCSDGLTSALSPQNVHAIVEKNPRSPSESLVNAALRKQLPHQDNISVLTLCIEEEEEELDQVAGSFLGKVLLPIAAVALLLLGIGGYYLFSGQGQYKPAGIQKASTKGGKQGNKPKPRKEAGARPAPRQKKAGKQQAAPKQVEYSREWSIQCVERLRKAECLKIKIKKLKKDPNDPTMYKAPRAYRWKWIVEWKCLKDTEKGLAKIIRAQPTENEKQCSDFHVLRRKYEEFTLLRCCRDSTQCKETPKQKGHKRQLWRNAANTEQTIKKKQEKCLKLKQRWRPKQDSVPNDTTDDSQPSGDNGGPT